MNKNAKTLRNIVWITFAIALVLVNVIAEVGFMITGIEVHMMLRIMLIIGVTFGAAVLGGSAVLIRSLDQEKSLSGNVHDTLGADRAKD
jgi:hypothetical protein